MDVALIIVTLVSLGLALVLLLLNWRLIRRERGRSAARVDALLGAVSAPEPIPASVTAVQNDGFALRPLGPSTSSGPMVRTSNHDQLRVDLSPVEGRLAQGERSIAPPWRTAVSSDRRSFEPRAAAANAIADDPAASAPLQFSRGTPEAGAISSHDLFYTAAQPASPFRRLALPVSLGVAIVGALLTGLVLWSSDSQDNAPVAAAPAASVPLELISLRHERAGDRLSITGLVRNPVTGRQVSGVNVVVFVFDRTGSFVTSARGPLDFRMLAPGDESPFVLALDKIGSVGRYRVSFRADDKVVPHVDRRQAPSVAVARSG